MTKRAGLTLLDVVLSIGIIGLLFGAIFLAYSSILDATANAELRTVASSVLNRHIEVIRNLPYSQVGTVGGVPSGAIPQVVTSTLGGAEFQVRTTIRNIDDPFDGTLGGVPNDTAPADYKLAELEVSCPSCARFVPLALTTTVSPKNLEAATQDGSLFVNVFDASGIGIGGVSIHVSNASVTPIIDLFDTANASGVLQLVGIPTSTQRYAVEVSKIGYSSDKTYLPGGAGNPNPLKPHATIAGQTTTQLSFSIDRVSTVNVRSYDITCVPQPNADFTLAGSKLIGTSPDVLKFSTSSATDGSGAKTFSNLEWDTYALALTEPGVALRGTVLLSPLSVNPATVQNFWFIIASSSPSSLLVTVKDGATGAPIPGAAVTASRPGFSSTLVTNRDFLRDTDWSGGAYTAQDGGIDAASPPGTLKLLVNASGTYDTGITHWLTSRTFDIGSSTAALYNLFWDPASQPPQTGAGSVKFQIASNNDNATWNFVGPDGTAATFYTNSSSTITGQNGRRYFRYQAFMRTDDGITTPHLNEVSLEFSGACVPASQVLFGGLVQDTYTLTVAAPGYQLATTSIAVASSSAAEILLSQ